MGEDGGDDLEQAMEQEMAGGPAALPDDSDGSDAGD
jgi:hypothetical protein